MQAPQVHHMQLVRPVVDLKASYACVYPRVELELRDGLIAVGRAVVYVEVRIVEIHRALLGPGGDVYIPRVGVDPYNLRQYVPRGKRARDMVHALFAGRRRRAFRAVGCLRERLAGKVPRRGQCHGGKRRHGRDCRHAEAGGHRRPACSGHRSPPPQGLFGTALDWMCINSYCLSIYEPAASWWVYEGWETPPPAKKLARLGPLGRPPARCSRQTLAIAGRRSGRES